MTSGQVDPAVRGHPPGKTFFERYFELLDAWAAWAADEIEAWGDIRRPPADLSPLDTLADIAALRPAR